jgi:serine/threonine-protein kinase RsbW
MGTPAPTPAVTSNGAPPAATEPARWHRDFPATPDQVPQARHFLAALLDGSPAASDALLCLTELAANSVLHSRSARPGGRFAVRVTRTPGRLKVEVTDDGGPWAPRPPGDGHGRGLAIVHALAAHVHISSTGHDAPTRTATFDMSQP